MREPVINRKPPRLHNSLVINDKRIDAGRNFAFAASALFLSTVGPACFSIESSGAATANPRTHHPVKAGTPSSAKQAIKPVAVAPPSPPPVANKPPPVAPVIERIRNQSLPVMFINERLIRDIMVGKPVETAPPSGTEAFSPEEAPAPAGLPMSDESAVKTPSSPDSSLAPDLMSTPTNVSTPPASDTLAPASQDKAKPADTATDKQSNNSESAPINAEAVSPVPVAAPEETGAQSAPAQAGSSIPDKVQASDNMSGVATVGGEVFGDAVADQDAVPLHGNLDTSGASTSSSKAEPDASTSATQTASPPVQEQTLDTAASPPNPAAPPADAGAAAKASPPHDSIEFDSASTNTETVMDSAATGNSSSDNANGN